MKTRELDLCVSCEICSTICPKNAVRMEYKNGQFLPKVDSTKCTGCGSCLKLCPGIDIDPFGLRYRNFSDHLLDGTYLESYTAYSNDLKIRKNSASGGLITTLIVELIKNKEFDAAFILDFDMFTGRPARLRAVNNIYEIINAAKSKYVPASVCNIIKTLKMKDNKRFIIVGTPCQILGIKKFIEDSNIPEEKLLFLGLFCEKTLNFNLIRYFEDTYGNLDEKLSKLEFRTKEKRGWPGDSKLYFNSGREIIVNRNIRILLKKFFQLNRCLFCLDKLNRLADISFGDCYIQGKKDFYGKSNVIIRTEKGKQIFDKYSHLFTLERENIEEIRKSQNLADKKDNLDFVKILIKKTNIYPNTVVNYRISDQAARRLSKLQKYIAWGKNYNKNIKKIRVALVLLRTLGKIEFIYNHLKKTVLRKITKRFSIHSKKRILEKTKSKGIVIVGATLYNKGSQAMIFTVVDQIRKRFPNKNIYLLSSTDFKRKDEEKRIYRFNILPWDVRTKFKVLFWSKKFKKDNTRFDQLENYVKEVIKSAELFIDISGYALSSQWGWKGSINYLLNIVIAKKYSIPYYVFPQSLGPFNYPLICKLFLYPLMKLYLKYPKKIFVREEEGLKCVCKITKRNVEKSYDIVLQSEEYNLSNIYNKNVFFKLIKIKPNSVCIIPNMRVIERVNQGKIYSIYRTLIQRLININKKVYILRYSYEDLEVCKKIKNLFPYDKRVRLISDDLNVIELENIIKQSDFVIASRYHSIIHAYKNGIPALIIGWATKYFELSKNFDQTNYFFDCRKKMSIKNIERKLDNMLKNYKYEKIKIINKMKDIVSKEESIFNYLYKS